jgi:hypothetical protein
MVRILADTMLKVAMAALAAIRRRLDADVGLDIDRFLPAEAPMGLL